MAMQSLTADTRTSRAANRGRHFGEAYQIDPKRRLPQSSARTRSPAVIVVIENLEAIPFRERLKRVAGFQSVPEPLPMKNGNNAVVYYLFFASQKPVAENIITDIFAKYR
jgi:hypothetical protein